ncbi:SynChlorMet cassette radical SAM/SPASM protein ScmE [Thermodesulfobacteriota bacterium]
MILSAPMTIDIAITNRCNLRCTYCSHFSSPGDVDKELPGKDWMAFFKELNTYGVMAVSLQGGEPFIREDLYFIIDAIVSNRMRFNILSNGTLITDKMAAFISSTGRCDSVQISIDGSIPTTHDSFRGEGNFSMAIQGLQFLKKFNIPTDIRVTIHRQNVRELEKIAKLILEEIGLESFSTNAASYMGLCTKNSEMVQLTIEERCLAMETLLELCRRYPGRINATAGPLAEAKTWTLMNQARIQGMERFPGGGFLTGCNGVLNKLAVRADGVLVPCIQMSHIELGRINQDDLREIWQNHKELKRMRERNKIPLSDFKNCRGCDYLNYCTGNCPALAYTILGVETHPSPDSCLRRFLDQGGHLPEKTLLSCFDQQ